MNYKTEMTENNETIQELLSTLQNLPNLADAQQGAYVWKKLTAEGGDFVDFVVNDTETAYPDGGMQDGYWYEKFNPATLIASNVRKDVDIWGVIGTLVEGTAGIDFGTVTNPVSVTEWSDGFTVAHNLGVTPTHVIFIRTDFSISNYETTRFFLASYDTNAWVKPRDGLSYPDECYTTISITKNAESIALSADTSSAYLQSGITYYWFAIA